jgi:hypothetical protein
MTHNPAICQPLSALCGWQFDGAVDSGSLWNNKAFNHKGHEENHANDFLDADQI